MKIVHTQGRIFAKLRANNEINPKERVIHEYREDCG